MWIKRKDLEVLASALKASAPFRSVYKLDHKMAVDLGQRLLALPDPVDVVPVHDYPFPLPVTEDPSK